MVSVQDLLDFRKRMLVKPGLNWGLANTPEEFRIDPSKKYTSNGKQVIGLEVVLYNSPGIEVTYPVKGSVVIRRKPWKTEYKIWTLDGRVDCVFGDYSKWDLMPVEENPAYPKDKKVIVASFYDGLIVWSRTRSAHQVRYGHQVKGFGGASEAAAELGECIHHFCESEGKLD